MSLDGDGLSNGPETDRPVCDLYAGLTEIVRMKNPEYLAIHRGLWGPDTKTNGEALERANRILVPPLGPGQHVLDAGCGVGGTAISLARAHGVRVTGLTNCEPHVAAAAQFAEERGVAHLVEFLYGDFMDLPFPDANFDAVLNQESFCHADDKLAYLEGVYRVLKPGGRWQALDGWQTLEGGGLRNGTPMSEEHRALIAAVERNWRLPPIEPWRRVLAALKTAGFVEIREQDLTSEALPSTDRIRKIFSLFSFMNPQTREINPELQEFMDGSVLWARGLFEGLFTYRFYSGMRPIQ